MANFVDDNVDNVDDVDDDEIDPLRPLLDDVDDVLSSDDDKPDDIERGEPKHCCCC